jgi:tetratricopeptide (TPR) repeat protein
MEGCDHWNLLRFGTAQQAKAALREIHHAYTQNSDASHIMELGAAYLWIQQYATAHEHFEAAIERHPTRVTDFYGMAGTAKWCMGENGEAVKCWLGGLDAEFADTNGLGIHLPLLLFYASIMRPDIYSQQSARKILSAKSKDRRIEAWPGPIARWLLGQLNDQEFRQQWNGFDGVDSLDRQWLAGFYQSVLWHGQGKHSAFNESMRKLADTSSPEWTNETFFLARMWGEEFFLARNELATPAKPTL